MYVNTTILKRPFSKKINGELKEDLKEIARMSNHFLGLLSFNSSQEIRTMKVDISEAKILLSQMISRLVTLVSTHISEPKCDDEKEIRETFQKDLGIVISTLTTEPGGTSRDIYERGVILKYASKLKQAWDGLIYYPIVKANRNSSSLEDYINNIFKLIRINASILSQEDKRSPSSPTKQIFPNIRGGFSNNERKSDNNSEESLVHIPPELNFDSEIIEEIEL